MTKSGRACMSPVEFGIPGRPHGATGGFKLGSDQGRFESSFALLSCPVAGARLEEMALVLQKGACHGP